MLLEGPPSEGNFKFKELYFDVGAIGKLQKPAWSGTGERYEKSGKSWGSAAIAQVSPAAPCVTWGLALLQTR